MPQQKQSVYVEEIRRLRVFGDSVICASCFVQGFGNRVWVNPSQQKGGFIQPSSFPHGGHWAKGNGGESRDAVRASDFSFASHNRFSSLAPPNTFDRGGGGSRQPPAGGDEDDDKKLWVCCRDWCIVNWWCWASNGWHLMVPQGEHSVRHWDLGKVGPVGLLLLF